MYMRQWEVFNFPFPSEVQPHPCIVISNQAIIDNDAYDFINCLFCTTFVANAPLKYFHVRLDTADGLDHATVAKCNEIYRFKKDSAGVRRGMVTSARRQAIRRKLVEIFDLH
jgi:mRNA-degrading endonuclease toxin of MazEF toxin-antitoxin module